MKNTKFISSELLIQIIHNLIQKPTEQCKDIVDFLNKINPQQLYFNSKVTDRILFFDNDYKYEVLTINETYHDIVKIFDHVFKTKLLFKNTKLNNYYHEIIIDNEILLSDCFVKNNWSRFTVIKELKKLLAQKLNASVTDIRFSDKNHLSDNRIIFTYNNDEYLFNADFGLNFYKLI